MKKLLAIVLITALGIFFVINQLGKNENVTPKQTLKAKIGLYNGDSSALALFAKEKGFFKDENLDLEFKLYRSGKDAFNGMLKGEVDYSNATEYVAIKNSYTNSKFKILGSMATAKVNGMLAKKSSGINEIKDIKNKKIGTTIGTASEYFTGVFLLLNSFNYSDINLIDVPVKQRKEVFENDKVDGLFAWEPFNYNMLQKYENKLNYFEMPAGFEFYFIFAVNDEFHTKNKNLSSKIVRALLKAEDYLKINPLEFRDFIKNKFNYDYAYTDFTLKRHNFTFMFPYTLSISMHNQSKWLEREELVNSKMIGLKTIFDSSVLKELDNTKVTLVGNY